MGYGAVPVRTAVQPDRLYQGCSENAFKEQIRWDCPTWLMRHRLWIDGLWLSSSSAKSRGSAASLGCLGTAAHWARLQAPTARTIPQRHHPQGHQARKQAWSTRTVAGTGSPLNLAVSCPHFLAPKPSLSQTHVLSVTQGATVHEGITTHETLDST